MEHPLGPNAIREDLIEEGARLMAAARPARITLRVMGGVAVALHAPAGLPPTLARRYADLDLVAASRAGRETVSFLTDMGYEPNDRFNAMHGNERLVFYDIARGRQVDVFVGTFRMCHTVPIADRLELDPVTLPLAELLLTKLQVVHTNAKDLKDVYALLLEHEVGDHDADTINAQYVGRVLAGDWGLWRTSAATLETARERLGQSGLDGSQQAAIATRIERLWGVVEAAPKSMRWRARARLGERVRWYEEPEEIAHEIGPSG